MTGTRSLRVTLSALLSAALAATASAQDRAVGPYLGAGISMAFEDFDLPPGVSADDSLALDLLGGYRVSSRVALEGELQYLDEFDLDGFPGEIDGWTLSGSVKLFPLEPTQPIQPFLAAGLGFAEFDLDGPGGLDGDESDWLFLVGAGIDFPIADRTLLEIRASYRSPDDDLDDLEYWTLGANLQYRF
jgi:hypothetical protein